MVEEALAVGVEKAGHLLAADVQGEHRRAEKDAAQGEQPLVFQVDQSEGVFAESRQERPALLQRTAPAPTETRTYGYQGWQYYVASGAGPWSGSPLSWTYDKIGNRMSETRGGLTDGYVYTDNSGSTGDTALLDVVNLGVGGTRDYTFDGGGYLGQISAGANVLAYTFDAAGELASVVRGAESLTNTYDGRGFLSQASDGTSGGYVKPTYSSAGLLLSQERLPTTGGTTERIDVLYFAGRPAAIWKKVGTSAATTTYVTTDPLGAPMFALNPAGTELWKGGFEPFGRDWQEGTGNDALTKGIFLRLPGQWDDTLFGTATLGADSYYNLARWYKQQTGRYTRPDPAAADVGSLSDIHRRVSAFSGAEFPAHLGDILRDDGFAYSRSSPLRHVDPDGRTTTQPNDLVTCSLLKSEFETADLATDAQGRDLCGCPMRGACSGVRGTYLVRTVIPRAYGTRCPGACFTIGTVHQVTEPGHPWVCLGLAPRK
ncbi:MAG: hypothetical protein U0X73_12200 [Thermoanaerobaculia bacterium]